MHPTSKCQCNNSPSGYEAACRAVRNCQLKKGVCGGLLCHDLVLRVLLLQDAALPAAHPQRAQHPGGAQPPAAALPQARLILRCPRMAPCPPLSGVVMDSSDRHATIRFNSYPMSTQVLSSQLNGYGGGKYLRI